MTAHSSQLLFKRPPPSSLMPVFGIKPPTKAGWDVAGKPHQLVPCTQQSEMNKHHLAPFSAGMVRKME